jgi:NADH-quinone oxidoreductase subunit N
MFRDEPADLTPLNIGAMAKVTLFATLAATVLLGVYPGPLSELANLAAQSFFTF